VRAPVLLALLLTPLAHAADVRGAARGWVGPGFDSNAPRDTKSGSEPTQGDGFLYGLVQLEGAVDFERARVVGAYDIAARKFLLLPSEDTLVQNAQLESTFALGRAFAVGLSGRARDRRGAGRDYTDLVGDALIDFTPDEAVDVRVRFGAHRFLYWPSFGYSFSGPEGSVSARYRLNRRHSASLSGGFNPRRYNALTHEILGEPQLVPQVPRTDSVMHASLSYSYRGPFHLSVGYSFFDQASNSRGESMRRHRLSSTLGLRLPWELMLFASLAVQLAQYPDDLWVNPDLSVADDDENSSSATLKLSRPLTKHVDLDLRYAVYVNVFPKNEYLYVRHVASVGVAVSF